MLDRDLDYCSQQMKNQLDDMRPVREALKQAQRDLNEATLAVNRAKKEENCCKHVVKQLRHKLGQQTFVLNKMKQHYKGLRLQKNILKNQHKMIDKGSKKNETK